MGTYLRLVDHDRVFANLSTKRPYIVNEQDNSTEADKKRINNEVMTTYESDTLSNMPTCGCGETKGAHLLGPGGGDGVICQECNTPVRAKIEREIEPLVWIRAPEGVRALINPEVYNKLHRKFNKSGVGLVRWLCDVSYQPTNKQYEPLLELQQRMAEHKPPLKRGLNSFVDNFDIFLNILFSLRNYRTRGDESEELFQLLHEQRDAVFSQYLPIPNRSLMVIEKSNVGTWVDPTLTDAINAVRIMEGIDFEPAKKDSKEPLKRKETPDSIRKKENQTIKAIALLASYYENMYKNNLAKKSGWFRKHVFGSRAHWSFRAVISSITDPHDYEEMYIPWGIGTSVFRIHLYNKLQKRGYTPNEAIEFLNVHANKYHPLLDELFKQLIDEAPTEVYPDGTIKRGIACILQRNPSLARASAQRLLITRVKIDPDDPTISMSIKDVRGANAKFQLAYSPVMRN